MPEPLRPDLRQSQMRPPRPERPLITSRFHSLNDEDGYQYTIGSQYVQSYNYAGQGVELRCREGTARMREDIALKLMQAYLESCGYVVLSPSALEAMRFVVREREDI